jgi:Domain of unknown function (DUF5615)
MPLSLLLDENISSVVAQQIQQKRPDIPLETIHTWEPTAGQGRLLGKPDSYVLRVAHAHDLTVVTFDTQILSELYFWFAEERPFSGLIFIDEKTIANNDFGLLVYSLIAFWDKHNGEEWKNRLAYLDKKPST